MKTILVSSHRRSGTHFLIDSIRANIDNSIFPDHRKLPADFNLGSLFSKDYKILKIFKELINMDSTVIIKSHLLPEECNIKNPNDEYEELIKQIFISSKKLYISRDGKDTIVSLYKFLDPTIDFSEFIRSKNDHIVKEVRSENYFDKNRILYWSYHKNQWEKEEDVFQLQFQDLSDQYEKSIQEVLKFLNEPTPKNIIKPQIPKIKIWNRFRKRLSKYGIGKLPESSSVKPDQGKSFRGINSFNNEADIAFFMDNVKK